MGSAIAFDTLAYSKKLKNVGFTEQQAEVLAETQAELIEERLATKKDLEQLRLATKQDIELSIANLKAELIKWVVGISAAQAALIVAILKLL